MLKDFDRAIPYEGAKEMISVPEPFDRDLLNEVVTAMCR